MTTTREFFLMEARDCLERLNALLQASDDALVDAAELHRVARALRGSAQMARETRVQAVAHALEVAGRALVQGALAWGADLRGILQRSLADVSVLVEADGSDAQLDGRTADVLERWERQGLELPAFPDATGPAPVAGPETGAPAGGLAVADAGVVPEPTDARSGEDLPVEVVNFFRAEAGALLDRIERMARDRPQAAGDRQGTAYRELADTITALRDLAATFGFGRSADAAERLLDRVEQDAAAGDLLADVRRLVASEVPGQPGPPATAAETEPGEVAVPDHVRDPAGARVPEPRQQAREGDDVVPMEDLLYRGEAALRRALELRPALDRAIGEDAAVRETVDELFDLIRLGLR